MVSGLVAYDSGAQEMGEKRRRKAFSGIRRKPKLRRKNVKVERTETHDIPQGNARERTVCTRVLERGRNTLCGGDYSAERNTRDSVSSAPILMRRNRSPLCAFYNIFVRIFVRSAY